MGWLRAEVCIPGFISCELVYKAVPMWMLSTLQALMFVAAVVVMVAALVLLLA